MKVTMENFCCCCKLETGGLVLGVMATITSIGFFIASLFAYSESMQHIRDHFLLSDLLEDSPDHVVHIIFLALTIIDIGTSVLLLIGVIMVNDGSTAVGVAVNSIFGHRAFRTNLSGQISLE